MRERNSHILLFRLQAYLKTKQKTTIYNLKCFINLIRQ